MNRPLKQLSFRKPIIPLNKRRKKTHKFNPFSECSICKENIYLDEKELQCNHKFHNACIKQWTMAHKRNCPLCRAEIIQYCQKIKTGYIILQEVLKEQNLTFAKLPLQLQLFMMKQMEDIWNDLIETTELEMQLYREFKTIFDKFDITTW